MSTSPSLVFLVLNYAAKASIFHWKFSLQNKDVIEAESDDDGSRAKRLHLSRTRKSSQRKAQTLKYWKL